MSAETGVRAHRTGLTLVLLAALIVNTLSLDWGLPNHYSWAPNNVHPYMVLNGMKHRFSGGWFDKYPPLHYALTAAAYLPVMADWDEATRADLETGRRRFYEDREPGANLVESKADVGSLSTLILAGRLLSALMTTLIPWALYLAAAELFGRTAGVMAALLAAFHPVTVFFAHTVNTEAAFLMWSAFGLAFFVRALVRQDLANHLALGLFAALATATKQQAFGLFVLLPLVLARFRSRTAGEKGWRAWARALASREMRWCLGAFVIVTILANNLVFNLDGYFAHLAFNAPGESILERQYPLSLSGIAALGGESLRWIHVTASTPVLLVCLAGLLASLRTDARRAGAVLFPGLSYFAVFLVAIGFLVPRYVTPIVFLLMLFGGRFLADLWRWPRLPWPARGALAALGLAWLLVLGGGVDLLFRDDPRYEAEAWLRENVPAGARVQVFSSPKLATCRLPEGPHYLPIGSLPDLVRIRRQSADVRADYLVLNEFHRNFRFTGETPAALIASVRHSFNVLGYDVVEVLSPRWSHSLLVYLQINPYVIIGKRQEAS